MYVYFCNKFFFHFQEYGSVRWTEGNIRVMLDTLKEWRLVCHDDGELELMLGSGQPVWKEVASRLSNRYKVCPNKCQERFSLVTMFFYFFLYRLSLFNPL